MSNWVAMDRSRIPRRDRSGEHPALPRDESLWIRSRFCPVLRIFVSGTPIRALASRMLALQSAKSAKYIISRKISKIRQSPHYGISLIRFWRYVETMNENHIPQTPINRNPQSYVRQAVIPYEERMAFVESVCAALNESRFGSGRVAWSVVKLSNRPELEPAVFYDLSDDGILPWYALPPLGRGRDRIRELASKRVKQLEAFAFGWNDGNSTNLLASNRDAARRDLSESPAKRSRLFISRLRVSELSSMRERGVLGHSRI